ncbi:MAG TPA: ABC transporter substrate-binding protein [Sphingomicrobium sp.]
MPASALLLGASAAVRAASLNLCTDELLLLLARPEQVVSVTHLVRQEAESPLWRRARLYPRNDGTLLDVAARRPNVVFTMGGQGHDRAAIAKRLGIRVVILPYPQSIDDVIVSVKTVGQALGRQLQAERLVTQVNAVRRGVPARSVDTLYLSGGGLTVGATSLAAQWMRLAGLRQRSVRGDRVGLEQLLVSPPAVLLRSNYRTKEYSSQQRWLAHPLAARAKAKRTLTTDGRRWTCMGPLLVPEILRLRGELSR